AGDGAGLSGAATNVSSGVRPLGAGPSQARRACPTVPRTEPFKSLNSQRIAVASRLRDPESSDRRGSGPGGPIMAKRILVPLSQVEAAESFVDAVAPLARGAGATVRLPHVAAPAPHP